jgi:hypothetical protein
MERDRAKERSGEGEASSSIEQRSTPTSEVLVARSNKREIVVNRNLIGGKREAKVRLREGGHRSAKNIGEGLRNVIRHTNGKKGGLVIVDGETRS